jgi:hypothetical protein
MSRSHQRRASAPSLAQRVWQAVWKNAPFALLALTGTMFIAAVIIISGQTARAGISTPASNSGTGGDWITLHDHSPAAIIAAARQSPLFHVDRSGTGDYLTDLSRLGVPQEVDGYATRPGVTLSDYYIIPVLDGGDNSVGAAVLRLNGDHSAIEVQSIDTYAVPRPHGAVAQLDQTHALAAVATHAHTQLAIGAHPRLVYFAFDFQGAERGAFTWNSGGEFPDDPIWLVPGMDGRDHLVGTDGNVYDPAQLPVQS